MSEEELFDAAFGDTLFSPRTSFGSQHRASRQNAEKRPAKRCKMQQVHHVAQTGSNEIKPRSCLKTVPANKNGVRFHPEVHQVERTGRQNDNNEARIQEWMKLEKVPTGMALQYREQKYTLTKLLEKKEDELLQTRIERDLAREERDCGLNESQRPLRAELDKALLKLSKLKDYFGSKSHADDGMINEFKKENRRLLKIVLDRSVLVFSEKTKTINELVQENQRLLKIILGRRHPLLKERFPGLKQD